MGERGPIPMSKESRKLGGNAGKRPLPRATNGAPSTVVLECPDWVSQDARAYWDKIVPMLIADGTVSERDWSALVNLCEAWGDFQRATRELAKEGTFYTGPNGAICTHPALKVKTASQKLVNSMMEKFGLQPTTRARLPITPPGGGERDSYEEFLEEGSA